MPPVGLLALIALALVFTLTLRERVADPRRYAVVRTETRYRADMRVIRESAARIEGDTTSAAPVGAAASQATKATRSSKALAPRVARASIRALGGSVMTRPASPLDRAAIIAQRQRVTMQRDRERVLARRATQARRRALVALATLVGTLATWSLVAFASWSMWSGVIALGGLGSVLGASRAAVLVERAADSRLLEVKREVEAAATATAALQRIAVERAAGRPIAPSLDETQAIATVTAATAKGMFPPQAPADALTFLPLPLPENLPGPAVPRRVDPGWSPGMLPIPAYTLKPAAPPRAPRLIREEDLAQGARAAQALAERRAAAVVARAVAAPEREASTQTLEDILARRRRTA